MKKKISCLVISFALAFSLATFFSFALAQTPSLVIESPKNGEIVNKDEVLIRFKVENFTITDFRKNPPPRTNQGHLHFWIDQVSPTTQNAIQHISKEPYLLTKLQPKEHTLVVELVGNDHASLKPQVKQAVKFTTTGIPKKEGANQITPLTTTPTKQAGGQTALGAIIAVAILAIVGVIIGGVIFYKLQLEKSKKSKKLTRKPEQEEG
jgi:hypothetical protein